MNKIFTLITLTFIVSTNAQNISFKKREFNIPKVLSELFEAKYNEDTKEFVWKPNFAEKLEFGVSSDGYLYTKVDTLLTYGVNKNIGTIVTSTYVKDEYGEKESCHACAPSMSLITFTADEARENLELTYFKKFAAKYGSWGEPAEAGVLQITEDSYCITLSSGWTGQGINMGYQNLFYEGENILHINNYEDNFGATDKKNEQISYETIVSIDKIKSILILTKKGNDIDPMTNKKVLINEIEKFKFDEFEGKFTKICN